MPRRTDPIGARVAWPDTYSTDLVDTQYFDLGPGATATGEVPFTFSAGRDYMVRILVTPVSFAGDTMADNDEHRFRFQTSAIAFGPRLLWNKP